MASRAATELAFEFAGRVQAEIEALDWIVAEQKLTVDGSSDVDVHGWADGTLVSFEVRDGRMVTWQQRECSERAARPLLGASPAHWASFAERNARLAALLATA